MLSKVRKLVAEHRRSPEFHYSEQNPSYLKLMMMEQLLESIISEDAAAAISGGLGKTVSGAANLDAAKNNATGGIMDKDAAKKQMDAQIAKITDPKLKAIAQKKASGNNLTPDEQTLAVNAAIMTPESKHRLGRLLRESEVQQAQVVLASQDLIDNVQKMLEEVTAMQFKDLPALVDQIKYQFGPEQASQFQTDAAASLSSLVEALQGSKGQLEQALSVVTGQAPVVPGQGEAAPDLGGEEGAELPDLGDIELPDLGGDEEEEEVEVEKTSGPQLGRGRR